MVSMNDMTIEAHFAADVNAYFVTATTTPRCSFLVSIIVLLYAGTKITNRYDQSRTTTAEVTNFYDELVSFVASYYADTIVTDSKPCGIRTGVPSFFSYRISTHNTQITMILVF